MRSLTGVKKPELAADPIIVHPDVRKMLLSMKVRPGTPLGCAVRYLTT
jgi:hypothetical protein